MLSYEISYLSSNTSASKLSVGRDINVSDTWSLHWRTARLLNGHLRSNFTELRLNNCSFNVTQLILNVLFRRRSAGAESCFLCNFPETQVLTS